MKNLNDHLQDGEVIEISMACTAATRLPEAGQNLTVILTPGVLVSSEAASALPPWVCIQFTE